MGRRFGSCRIYSGRLVLACVLLGSAAAQPAAADTLAGETLLANSPVFGGGAGETATVNCGPTPQSPFTYHAEGQAIGPHPGTFTEDGTVATGGAPNGIGVTDLDATFTITSTAGNVTGEKHFVTGSNGAGTCVSNDLANFSANICYQATFANGSTEQGISNIGLSIFFLEGTTTRVFSFVETLTPDATVVCGAPCNQNAQGNQNQGNNQQGCKND